MAGAEGLEPSARGFGGNVKIYLTLRLLPGFEDLLPTAPLMLEELMLFWWYAKFYTRFLMLLTLNLDSTVWNAVGIADRSSEQDCRLAMRKICVALNKEKGIRNQFPCIKWILDFRKGTLYNNYEKRCIYNIFRNRWFYGNQTRYVPQPIDTKREKTGW